jgi:carbonic anhydrase
VEDLDRILANNRAFSRETTETDPGFFQRNAGKQEPHFLFIGCADSRVPLEMLTRVLPGEMFVHRNIANQVMPTDMNLLSVLQYAVEVLDVKHVIVCGHELCGGVAAALEDIPHGLVDHWLHGVRETSVRHADELASIQGADARFDRLIELNVLKQVHNLARTPIVENAWRRGPRPLLHGMVYGLRDGLLKVLISGVDGPDAVRRELERYSGELGY